MPMKQTGRTIYKSMQGKQIDMDMLRQRNELTQAVGNAKVNARGDEIGPGGKIIRRKEDLLKEYYENSSSMPDEIALKKPVAEKEAVVEAATTSKTKNTTTSKANINTPAEKDLTDDWVEDDAGNFVQKGD
jgi:hypothetical protein|tara:strand:- start:660 stop:1052 length:393 start_codon:yes stop_codon:yes gene_type:complete